MRTILTIIAALITTICYCQNDFRKEFDSFLKSNQEDFQKFVDDNNALFAGMLDKAWESFSPDEDTLSTMISGKYCIEEESGAILNFSNLNLSRPCSSPSFEISISLFGKTLQLRVPENITDIHLGGTDEHSVSVFWRRLSSVELTQLYSDIQKETSSLCLNDWGLYNLVYTLSDKLYPANSSERSLLTTFLLSNIGIRCKISKANERLIPLVATKQHIYKKKYISIGSERYFIFENCASIKEIKTYKDNYTSPTHLADLQISTPVTESNKDDITYLYFSSRVFEDTFCLPISSFTTRYLDSFPQMDVVVYAKSEVDRELKQALCNSIRPKLKNLRPLESVNLLLSFLQNDFDYKEDTNQFGREKVFFCEENFIFPFNDCEDRSILFAFLVKELLDLDVALLSYSDHVSTAVALPEQIAGDSIRVGDRNFYICDPTFLGAVAGNTIPRYRSQTPEIYPL